MYTYFTVILVVFVAYILYSNRGKTHIRKMVQQCAHWATTAQQDASLLTGITHSNYAMGYLLSLKELATPKEIHRQTGVDFNKFEQHIKNVQEMMNMRATKKYPDISGDTDVYLSAIANVHA